MPTLNYSTSVPVTRTIAEMHEALARHGATRIATEYEKGAPSGLAFSLVTPGGPRVFTVPVNVPAVERLLTKQREANRRVDSRPEQAARVAWRVVREWLFAQLAIIEAELVTLDQAMLPYMQWDDSRTLYQAYAEHAFAGELTP